MRANEEEPGAGDQRPSCSPKTRRGGLRRISPSCRTCCKRQGEISARCTQQMTSLPRRKKMQKWEYNLLVQSPNTECARCEEALNGLGRDGWELVTFYVNGSGDNGCVLKKPKEQ